MSMEVRAQLRFYRKGVRKVRPVVDVIRGLSVLDAENQLMFMQKQPAGPILKLLRSAIANAEHNFKLSRTNLFVKTIMADGGPTIKRFKPRAQGRATPIRKRTCHVIIILAEREAKGSEVVAKPEVVKAAVVAKKPRAKAAAKKTATTA